MSFRRLTVTAVALLVASAWIATANAAPRASAAVDMQVGVDPMQACILAGEYPQFQGSVTPMDGVMRTRLFFKSALSPDFFFVESVFEGGRYVARIPKPNPEAGPLSFYFEATKADSVQGRSGDGNAIVVRKIEDCPADRKAVPVAPGGPVSVFDVAGNPAFPAGFAGIMGATGAAGGAAAVGAAAGGGFLTSTAGIVTLAALGAGIATTVIVVNHSGSQ
jgi:hypothetical protein